MGFGSLMGARWQALGQNLQTFLAVQGAIFLLPLMLVGAWRLRCHRLLRLSGLAWILTFVTMTFVFPFAGGRGGFFHSGAALQPVMWACAPLGLEAFLGWIGPRRRWSLPQARRFFYPGLVGLAILLTVLVFNQRVIGGEFHNPIWGQSTRRYLQQEAALLDCGARADQVVMVNDSPGYYVASQRPAISIPYGDLATVLDVARRYQASYLLLEFNQLLGSDDLYASPGDRPGLRYLGTVDQTRIYQFLGAGD